MFCFYKGFWLAKFSWNETYNALINQILQSNHAGSVITLGVIRLHINEHLYTILFPVNERHKQPKKEKAQREMNTGTTPCLFKQVSFSNTFLLCLVQSLKFLLAVKKIGLTLIKRNIQAVLLSKAAGSWSRQTTHYFIKCYLNTYTFWMFLKEVFYALQARIYSQLLLVLNY